jgi:hypothetical protein
MAISSSGTTVPQSPYPSLTRCRSEMTKKVAGNVSEKTNGTAVARHWELQRREPKTF